MSPPFERLGVVDAGEYLTLQRAAYVPEAQRHDAVFMAPLTETLAQMRAVLDEPAVHAWGRREDGRLVAAVRVETAGDVARVGRLVVAPDRQRAGIGRALMHWVETRLDEEVRAVELFTGEYSDGPLRLYRLLGYRETARTPSAGYDLVHLRKERRPDASPGPEWVVRRARPDDLAEIRALLDERVRWLHARGITGQWPAPFGDDALRDDLDAGATWLVDVDGVPAATLVLALPGVPDPWWADIDGVPDDGDGPDGDGPDGDGPDDDGVPDGGSRAAVLRRLAVRPGHAGLGARLLGWAQDYARTHGADRLRLTAVADNPALCGYYAAAGFTERGTVHVSGTRGEGRMFTMQRFERPL